MDNEELTALDATIEDIRRLNKVFYHRQNGSLYIPVEQSNEEDWKFVFVDQGGRKVMAVF